jgi:signal transduction histidine kinase
MTPDAEDPLRRLRHDLSNPLSAILAETQLLLLNADTLDADTVASLKEIERLSRRMRDMLQGTKER